MRRELRRVRTKAMKTFKARGIVIREYEAGESDKRLVLLCKELGRVMVYARGARKPGSKFMAAAQLFAYGDYVIADGRQFKSVSQAEVIESFYAIRTDYARLCHAHLMLEVCDKAIMEDTPCDELLLVLLRALTYLSKPAGGVTLPPEQVAAVFLFRFYLYYGIAPSVDECCVCGGEATITGDGAYFCDEGYVCKHCSGTKKHRLRLSQTAWGGLAYILQQDTAQAFRFTTLPVVIGELNRAARLCWDGHFEWRLQSGEFIRVGSSKAQKTNVRVVAATNIDLHRAIQTGRFREDLYYRLNTVPIFVPPLRERRGDIFLLFRKFAADIALQYRMPSVTLTDPGRKMLESYTWPGNVRQLKNVAEQISAVEQSRQIGPDTLVHYLPNYGQTGVPMVLTSSGGASYGSSAGSGFANATERDILYKLLFDLRGEVTELKGMLADLMGGKQPTSAVGTGSAVGAGAHLPALSGQFPAHSHIPPIEDEPLAEEFAQAEEVTEEVEPSKPHTKEEAQREAIIQALHKHGGRRKEAAQELFMSERTLYRKIKELGIEG